MWKTAYGGFDWTSPELLGNCTATSLGHGRVALTQDRLATPQLSCEFALPITVPD